MVRTSQKEAVVRQIALIDAKNFYCESERVHDITLRGKPLVVLTNNDGCPISRSDEAKALGIKMGDPWYWYEDLAKKHGVIALSSNYPLYADMSSRLMRVLQRYSPDQEIYSIDECFLDLTSFKRIDLTKYSHQICNDIFKGLGLPVRVGIGSTKTLAKLANHCAKKRLEFNGVCNLNAMTPDQVDKIMSETDINDLWGIGRRLTPKLMNLGTEPIENDLFATGRQDGSELMNMGIRTVLNLKQADPKRLREQFSVLMEKTIFELNGISCLELEEVPPPRKEILSSKSFGRPVTDIDELKEAITAYMTRAVEKLRNQKSAAGSVHVFIRTNPFRTDHKQYNESIAVPIPTESDDVRQLVKVAIWGLNRIFKPGFYYAKAGVMLSLLVPIENVQTDLFSSKQLDTKSEKVMDVMDAINRKWGRSTIKLASEGISKPWRMRQANKSPNYTTRWDELPVIYD